MTQNIQDKLSIGQRMVLLTYHSEKIFLTVTENRNDLLEMYLIFLQYSKFQTSVVKFSFSMVCYVT